MTRPQGPSNAQIIGLIKGRLSGIVLSRHAYADVLRTIWPDLRDTTVEEGRRSPCKVNVWAARPMSKIVLGDIQQPMTGSQIWCVVLESTNLPDGSLEACANANQVWVPSTFVRDVCIQGGMPAEKVKLVPYWIAAPSRKRQEPEQSQPFTVLTSWDGRSSINRKNIINSIQAFKLAFPRTAGARLRLKSRDLTEENIAKVTAAIDGDKRIILDLRTTDTVDEIFDGAHALLHIHRAEGYGRHLIEAMQRRLPVIATAYSGPMDWLTADNARLVGYTLTETKQSEFQYPQGGLWAEPAIEQAAEHLREVKKRTDTAMLDRAELAVFKHTTLEHARSAMVQHLREAGLV